MTDENIHQPLDTPDPNPEKEFKASVEAKCLECYETLDWHYFLNNDEKSCECGKTSIASDGAVTSPAVEIRNVFQLRLI